MKKALGWVLVAVVLGLTALIAFGAKWDWPAGGAQP